MKIKKKLLELQNKIHVPKQQYNSFGNYSFRSAEDILEKVKPVLNKLNLILTLTDDIIVKEVAAQNRVYVKATAQLVDVEDNETMTVSAYAREEEIKKGMDVSQITGAASSYARKYALNGLFLLDDNKDSDSTNKHNKEPVNTNRSRSEQEEFPTRQQQKEIKKIMNADVMKQHRRDLRQEYSTLQDKEDFKNFIKEIKQIEQRERRKHAS